MNFPMVDCRSLIEFCKAFEQHRNMVNSSSVSRHKRAQQLNHNINTHNSGRILTHPLCEKSSYAAIDVVVLAVVVVACGFLFTPYFKYVCAQAAEVSLGCLVVIGEVIYDAPIAYSVGIIVAVAVIVVVWEIYSFRSRRCDSPQCKGLRKAVEFDIQLESEECVKALCARQQDGFMVAEGGGLQLGGDHMELKAELRRMAPPNGRAVLIFRAQCGCPIGRMEVWGPKRPPRKSKK